MKNVLIVATLLSFFSCANSDPDRFEDEIVINNKSNEVISKVELWGNASSNSKQGKIWRIENLAPGKSDTLTINIKRDIKESEGSIYLRSYFSSEDSLDAGLYFSAWKILGSNKAFNIHSDRIEFNK